MHVVTYLWNIVSSFTWYCVIQIWLRRERRKIKRVKEVLGETIEDLKRQLSQAKYVQYTRVCDMVC
jgi:hypothetical protein